MRPILILIMILGLTTACAQTMTAPDVEAFLDGVMPLQLEREDIAGAVIAVVKDGHLLFAKGYGYSDVAKRTPVNAGGTLFRPGSISKLFTWTSIMQLVERKKLDLDRDVNDYIDFKIPATYAQPITLRNIMTHTPGFEETIRISSSRTRKIFGRWAIT
jgi:CubicO group peptidase (beta-lactamase class C family)